MNNNMFNFNQIGMNYMANPMTDINNQQNQINRKIMNETAQYIRNIIQPYENKIRELEEIIKQKDLEIIVLKQKLNNNFPNINNMNMSPMMMNMNMNPIMMNMNLSNSIIGNMNKQIKDKRILFCLTIIKEKKNEYVECFSDDKASILKEKCNLNEELLSFNYKIIDCDLTIEENGISNGSFIYVVNNAQNLIFQNSNGIKHPISLCEDCPIGMALIYYYIMIGRIDLIMPYNKEEIFFIFNALKIQIHDKTPINKFLNYLPCPIIKVDSYQNITL